MLKKTITYKDLDGNNVTEDFYFNFTKAELAVMQLGSEKGLAEHLSEIVKSNDQGKILDTFKMILMKAYGRRSEDNKRFIKSDQISEEFSQTDAFSELFMALVSKADSAAEFIRGVVPEGLSTELVELPSDVSNNDPEPTSVEDPRPAWLREGRDPTGKELMRMSKEELALAYQHKISGIELPQ